MIDDKTMWGVVVLLLTGAGALVMRYLRRDGLSESIKLRKEAADLIAHLEEIGVPMDKVDALIGSMGRRRGDKINAVATKQLSLEEQIEAKEYAEIEAAQSQSEMNVRQGDRAQRLDRRMDKAYQELVDQLHGSPLAIKLEQAQTAWIDFRKQECAFAGAPWEGGTMQPFIMSGTFSQLTKQRAEMLENELELVRREH